MAVSHHDVSTDTNDDYHRLTNLTGVSRIYYLLFAGSGGAYIDNTGRAQYYDRVSRRGQCSGLDKRRPPGWEASPQEVRKNATLTISAANLTQGTYNRTMFINSNDPATPQVSLPGHTYCARCAQSHCLARIRIERERASRWSIYARKPGLHLVQSRCPAAQLDCIEDGQLA
jgi:hypothetical protein